MRYFYCEQLKQFYRIEDTPKKIYAYESEKTQWTEIPITQSTLGNNCYEYTLDIGIANTKALLREPDMHTITNYVILEITIWSNPQSLFGKTQHLKLIEIPLQYIQAQNPELLKDSNPNTNTNSQQQLQKISKGSQSFFAESNQEDKHYDLSENQRRALEAHRETLRNRWTEYHFLSCIFFCFSCFSTGFSKTEKIEEITRLLDAGVAKAEVVEQGYTGSIVLGGSVNN
ncbi:hypothetical protein BN59_01592 [Legionella massiliensis]|uniref:Uncharacterized protein n=1 Tax=Legionella massiliensis TaxID=1034943 RepID=A0A078KZS3_9GAMM|nr:hypothetical protein [Legionella massiliensis]CDZ77309.1 hypothetical protein BN59_01592 [Legionella massiliensis]CEE13047.1 hypothetical protein BN1094_01592 [Legionella massiliensis]